MSALLIAAAAAMAAPSSDQWQLVWSDEFEGTTIDRSKWSLAVDCWGGGNNERQCYTASAQNASVADGVLTITARRKDTTGPALPEALRKRSDDSSLKTQPYSSAKLVTRGKAAWKYGRFEIRARLPMGQGTWPAIWMMPVRSTYGEWASSGEIDILETVNLGAPCSECPGGRENTVFGTLHFGGVAPRNTHKGEEYPYPPILDGGFHVFGLTWSPDRMVWTVDGRAYAVRNSNEWFTEASKSPRAPFDRPFYLILNLAVGGGFPESRDLKTVDPAAFPAEFSIDYVRVWQCRAAAAASHACET